MQNMRAFKDGNRLILVIEDADAGIETMVKALLSGNVKAIENLEPPQPMGTPQINTDGMRELKPSAKTCDTAKFLKKAKGTDGMRTIHVANENSGKGTEQPEAQARADKGSKALNDGQRPEEKTNADTGKEKSAAKEQAPAPAPKEEPKANASDDKKGEAETRGETVKVTSQEPLKKEDEQAEAVKEPETKAGAEAEQPAARPAKAVKPVSFMTVFELRDYILNCDDKEGLRSVLNGQDPAFVAYTKSESELRRIVTKLAG